MKDEPQNREVTEAYTRLSEQLTCLETQIEELTKVLIPILTSEPPIEAIAYSCYSSLLAQRLNTFENRIKCVTHHISNLIDRQQL